jgi:hypothetical protein
MLRSGILALALLAPSAAIPQTQPLRPQDLVKLLPAVEPQQPDIVFQNYPLVHRVDCFEGRGSAFRTGDNHWMSVAHVTKLRLCNIGGSPFAVTNQDGAHDFAQMDTPTGVPNGFPIDCGGFVPGRWYWAIGYAGGAAFQTAVAIYATIYTRTDDGERIFVGMHTVIPGMSGGPVLDPATGAAVGTVNAYNSDYRLSFSRELKDTSACGADIA